MIPLNFHGAPSQAPVWVTLFPDHQWDAGALQKPTSLDIVFSLFLFPSGEWVSRTWPCNFRVGVTLNCTLLGQIAHLLIKYLLLMIKASVSTTTSVGSFYSSRHFHAFSECKRHEHSLQPSHEAIFHLFFPFISAATHFFNYRIQNFPLKLCIFYHPHSSTFILACIVSHLGKRHTHCS